MRSSKAQIISGTNWKRVGCVKWGKEVMKSEGSFTFNCIVLDIVMWCFYVKNIPEPFQSPKRCSSGTGCKSTWEFPAVKSCSCQGINGGGAWPVGLMGFWPACWSWCFRSCERVVDTFLPRVVLPFMKMVPPVEQCLLTASHSTPASGACGTSATCWVMSTLYIHYI